ALPESGIARIKPDSSSSRGSLAKSLLRFAPLALSRCRDRQPSSAPRETRTPTRHTPDKALNLARLPIPPQARGGRQYRSVRVLRPWDFVPSEGPLLLRTHVRN